MEKVFSKFTKTRRKEFQIMTDIIDDGGKRYVIKSPLTEDSKEHIINMFNNYCASLKLNKISLCPCRMDKDSIVFDFITGKSYTTLLLECINKKNKLQFIKILIDYKDLVYKQAVNKENFRNSNEFEETFGMIDNISDHVSSTYLNIDMTFDNVILQENGNNIVIDYEWIMQFSIPIDFVIYRAIHGICIRYYHLIKDLFCEEELLELMGINLDSIQTYMKMENHFISYIYGTTNTYDNILKNYEKEKLNVKALTDSNKFLSQVFVDEGYGYSEEISYNFCEQLYNTEYCINVDISKYKKLNSIRFDPINKFGIVRIIDFSIILDNGEIQKANNLITNALVNIGDIFVFDIEDPQIIYDITSKGNHNKVKIIYEVLTGASENNYHKIINVFKLIKDDSNNESKRSRMIIDNLQNENYNMKNEKIEILNVNEKLMMKIETLQSENSNLKFEVDKLLKDIINMQNKIIQTEKVHNILIENKHCLEERLNHLVNEIELIKLNK